jgi:hypothetical protein
MGVYKFEEYSYLGQFALGSSQDVISGICKRFKQTDGKTRLL